MSWVHSRAAGFRLLEEALPVPGLVAPSVPTSIMTISSSSSSSSSSSRKAALTLMDCAGGRGGGKGRAGGSTSESSISMLVIMAGGAVARDFGFRPALARGVILPLLPLLLPLLAF